jgi:hypothetical protein
VVAAALAGLLPHLDAMPADEKSAAGRAPAASTRTASPTTSMPTRAASRARGSSTCCPDPAGGRVAQIAAVIQRARLLNAHARRPLRRAETLLEGLLPPALVYGHKRLSVAVPGHPAAGGHATCTSTRPTWRARPTGRWWVIADRTQAPSGRRLRAGEPPAGVARCPSCTATCRCSPGRLLPRPAATASSARPRRRRSRP